MGGAHLCYLLRSDDREIRSRWDGITTAVTTNRGDVIQASVDHDAVMGQQLEAWYGWSHRFVTRMPREGKIEMEESETTVRIVGFGDSVVSKAEVLDSADGGSIDRIDIPDLSDFSHGKIDCPERPTRRRSGLRQWRLSFPHLQS